MLRGTVQSIELKRAGRITFNLESDSVVINNQKAARKYIFQCSVYDENKKIDSLYEKLRIGNKIDFECVIQKPRDERNPGEFNYESYLNSKGIAALANAYETENLKIISNEFSFYENTIFLIRKNIDEKITSLHNQTTSALLRGLLLADQKSIDNEIKTEFINAGVVHVLSVSGLHVGYIVLIFVFAFSRFNVFTRYLLTVIGLLLYLIITGAGAPVFRSTIMALSILAAPATGREYNSLNALSLSALIILLITPNELFNPSFQLSFTAILSLIILYPPMVAAVKSMKLKSKAITWILIFCTTSVAAQIGTLPFTLTYFQRLSVTALFANLFVIPVSGAIVALGILTLIVGSISNVLGIVYASANELLTYLMYWVVKLLGDDKFSYLSFRQFSSYDAIVFYFSLALLFYVFKKSINPIAKTCGVVLSVLFMVLMMRFDNYELMPKNVLSIMAVDVGQGDALLIKFPNDKTALIDAGNVTPYFDNGNRIILPLLDKLGIKKIDFGIVSHVDADHYMGFHSLIKEGKINSIYKPLLDRTSQKDVEFEKFLSQQNIPIHYFSKEIIPVGNARIYVLNDTTNNYFGNQKSNDRSGMLKLVYGTTSFLFTGDAGVAVESDYVQRYNMNLRSDVLKLGHHGSRSSTSEEFLTKVDPQMAIISAGVANKFHHPSKEILERLNNSHISALRTDLSGAILLQSDGSKINSINWKQIENKFNF